MPGQIFEQAWQYVTAIAGDPATAIVDFRCIHDTDKAVPAIPFRGTLSECWSTLLQYNDQGYGCFAVVAAMDGAGRELTNVSYLRAHYCDLDNASADQNYGRAVQSYPQPSLGVHTSPSKHHIYWSVQPYTGNDYFQLIQRKLRQVFDGDRRVIDAARVMRLPGTWHLKDPSALHMVTCQPLPGFGVAHPVTALADALSGVNIIDGASGTRQDLGDPALAAPSIDWIRHALALTDPNNLDRGEWMGITYAVKQAGWSLTDPDTLFAIWSEWCDRYADNDAGENLKQWNSIRNTELGWPSLLKRVPALQAAISFNGRTHDVPTEPIEAVAATGDMPVTSAMPTPPPLDCSGEYLTHLEQQVWFDGCIYIISRGKMLTHDGRFLDSGQFNVAFGGKKFIIDTTGKMVNEAWQAATRSTLSTVTKVDHIRFIPSAGYHDIITDDLGRKGVNTYKAVIVKRVKGDASPFLNHIAALLPDPIDQRILLDFLAHNARFPGHKIPWAPVIQSAEGAGKGVLKAVMTHVMGRPYVHFPNAKELTNSGSQFNAWMRNKLFLLADEIKVDDRLDLIEVLKPMISESLIEIQSKGVDQDLEDNFANWMFFTNWKNAIPISKNARRFAVMYSPLQSAQDMLDRGMNEAYFNALYSWLENGGAAIVADWLLDYPIERGAIPMRAPRTSSTEAAVDLSRGPVERMVAEAVEDALPGFRGGWISATMVAKRIKATGVVRGGSVSTQTIGTVLESMGYVFCGRAPRPYFQEDAEVRPYLYHIGRTADIEAYGPLQGW